MQHLHLFWYLVFFSASRSFTSNRVLVACRVFPSEGKAGLFSQVSQSKSNNEARYGVSYIHVHSCTLMYLSIYKCTGTCVGASGSAREADMIVLGTTGGTVCTCGHSCTCMYVYRTIPYIAKSKKCWRMSMGGPGIIYFFFTSFSSLLGF